jgi:hypothetical protein
MPVREATNAAHRAEIVSNERFSNIRMTMCWTSSIVPLRAFAGIASARRMVAGNIDSAALAAAAWAERDRKRLRVTVPNCNWVQGPFLLRSRATTLPCPGLAGSLDSG